MRSIFLAALALLLATTAGCPQATAQAELAGRWLRFDNSICHTTIKDGARKEGEKCFDDTSVVGITKAGHHWPDIECPTNSITPPDRTNSKTDTWEETLIGRLTCATDGPRTILKWAGVRKDIYPQISLTQVAKFETILNFEASGGHCRILDYSRTIHAVNSDGLRRNGERIPSTIEDHKYRLGEAVQCRIFSSENEALEEK